MTITYHCRFIVILVLCTAAHAVQVGDLYRALDTNESVWMLKRNYTRPNHTCVRATKMFLNLTDYQFNQTFLNNTAKESELLNAKLGCDMKHEYMNVSKTQAPRRHYARKLRSQPPEQNFFSLKYSSSSLLSTQRSRDTIHTTILE
ncbi:uncharacterized protein LOC142785139 isoform X2 [Rhipicephalus microplus]|uniref:uncharacterized protein LOC142785139 isoform X2 n=1 Tax=Rhipicephalus microplus TaxID=6941 RepID=UPI003F6C7F7F